MPRRKRLRLDGHNYSLPGAYFVTLCVIERRCLFGEIADEKMRLNPMGEIVSGIWQGLPTHYEHLTVDEFVVMPNHVHGILHFEPGNQKGLPEVVKGFKAFSSRAVGQPLWQRSFHDRIVRSESDLARIREYIANNPIQWAIDEENPERKK